VLAVPYLRLVRLLSSLALFIFSERSAGLGGWAVAHPDGPRAQGTVARRAQPGTSTEDPDRLWFSGLTHAFRAESSAAAAPSMISLSELWMLERVGGYSGTKYERCAFCIYYVGVLIFMN